MCSEIFLHASLVKKCYNNSKIFFGVIMSAKSSIHIEQGHAGFLQHNSREKPTKNSVFFDEKNEYSCSAKEAFEIYRTELQKRTEAYTKNTNRKLHKKTITHLSAIVNLNSTHTLQDLKPLIKHLETTLDTKVFQVAIHRDEGHIDDDGNKIKNYHAHLEFLGLDSKGKSIRRKLTKSYLINLQTKTAELLKMQRGKNYTQERAKRPKRLDTYEFKAHKQQEAKVLKKEKLTVTGLRKEIAELREELKKINAELEAKKQQKVYTQSDYIALNKLKKELNKSNLQEIYKAFLQLKEQLQEKEQEKDKIIKLGKKHILQERKKVKNLKNKLSEQNRELLKLKEENYTLKAKKNDLRLNTSDLELKKAQSKIENLQNENTLLKKQLQLREENTAETFVKEIVELYDNNNINTYEELKEQIVQEHNIVKNLKELLNTAKEKIVDTVFELFSFKHFAEKEEQVEQENIFVNTRLKL